MINNNSHILNKLKNKPLVLFLSILVGSCFGLLVYIYHFQLPLFSKTNFVICLLLILVTSLLVALFLYRFILPIYKQLTKKQHVFLMAISLISTMLGIFYIEHTIPHIYPIYPNHELEITIDMREASSDMDRVSFRSHEVSLPGCKLFRVRYRRSIRNQREFHSFPFRTGCLNDMAGNCR